MTQTLSQPLPTFYRDRSSAHPAQESGPESGRSRDERTNHTDEVIATLEPQFGTGVHMLAPATPGSQQVRTVFGRYAAAVGALCAVVDGEPVGLVATSLAVGISYDPPMITFSCRKESATWPVLRRASRIGVSVLGHGQDQVCRQIAGPAGGRFAGVELHETVDGAVFLRDAMSWMDCRISAEIEAGDHIIVVLELLEVGHDQSTAPLIFLSGRFHSVREDAPA